MQPIQCQPINENIAISYHLNGKFEKCKDGIILDKNSEIYIYRVNRNKAFEDYDICDDCFSEIKRTINDLKK